DRRARRCASPQGMHRRRQHGGRRQGRGDRRHREADGSQRPRPRGGRGGQRRIERVSELFSIAGKTALVTGGSRGIGAMIARGYVEAGAKVYISSRKREVCDEVAAELSKIGTCVSLPANLSDEAACIGLAEEVA